MEEGEAGALCVSAVCLQDGGLRRHGRSPSAASPRGEKALPAPPLGGMPPSSAAVPGTEPTARTRNGLVDSSGACSGPSALRRPEAWPRGQTLPVSPLPLQAQAFSALRRGQLCGLAQANLSPDPGGVSSSGGGARPPAEETESEEPQPGHTPLSTTVSRRNRILQQPREKHRTQNG